MPRLPKDITFIESADRWQDSRFRLPKEGDLVVVDGGAIPTFKASTMANKLNAWVDVMYPIGTYFFVLDIAPFSNISPGDKGSMWHVLDQSRDRLLNVKFLRWRLVT